ncbi:hypothetical protein [Polynucleobacter sphagniphilus]|uniref:capsular polysaccharide export protein, LipB/KpsS family n=1 Tax=Polynucleobacter sphagniphilus TaxID=1743169 RepID=UPI0024751436|nr:hypothetical protein [Polynucleobacter sphagniphilus]MDH6525576.1 hypothetical protein [Polynucleobacter sphagniphilus]
MKTIIFFHRLELTDMYSSMAKFMEGKYKIIHLAYGMEEYRRLRIFGVVGHIYIFKDEIRALWEVATDPTIGDLELIDRDIIEFSEEAFNLNSAIQSDRGFSLLTYKECLKLTSIYYQFWNKFIVSNNVNFVMHEPTSLMMNFIAAIVCKKYAANYVYQIMCGGDQGDLSHLIMVGTDFSCPSIIRNVAEYQLGAREVDFKRSKTYLAKFRQDFSIYLGKNIKSNISLMPLIAISLRNRIRLFFQKNKYHRIIDNIEYWKIRSDEAGIKVKNLLNYKLKIKFYRPNPQDIYYYFPLHLEPEAVVLYHGHGIYKNQVKLIENIAGQLPPGTLLYVKDHPHDYGYRAVEDFLVLQQVPNIRLIHHNITGKTIINNSIAVITIAGTAGFEALLMGKQVFTFAKTFYSECKRVTYVKNIRDLRNLLYLMRGVSYIDDSELNLFVSAYLESLNGGLTDYFAGRAEKYGIDLEVNAKKLSESFISCFGI